VGAQAPTFLFEITSRLKLFDREIPSNFTRIQNRLRPCVRLWQD
jgi:hypothetical protein